MKLMADERYTYLCYNRRLRLKGKQCQLITPHPHCTIFVPNVMRICMGAHQAGSALAVFDSRGDRDIVFKRCNSIKPRARPAMALPFTQFLSHPSLTLVVALIGKTITRAAVRPLEECLSFGSISGRFNSTSERSLRCNRAFSSSPPTLA